MRRIVVSAILLAGTISGPWANAQSIRPPAQSEADRNSPAQACGTRDPRRFPQDCPTSSQPPSSRQTDLWEGIGRIAPAPGSPSSRASAPVATHHSTSRDAAVMEAMRRFVLAQYGLELDQRGNQVMSYPTPTRAYGIVSAGDRRLVNQFTMDFEGDRPVCVLIGYAARCTPMPEGVTDAQLLATHAQNEAAYRERDQREAAAYQARVAREEAETARALGPCLENTGTRTSIVGRRDVRDAELEVVDTEHVAGAPYHAIANICSRAIEYETRCPGTDWRRERVLAGGYIRKPVHCWVRAL